MLTTGIDAQFNRIGDLKVSYASQDSTGIMCDGRILDKNDYPELWDVVSNGGTIGSTGERYGDGSYITYSSKSSTSPYNGNIASLYFDTDNKQIYFSMFKSDDTILNKSVSYNNLSGYYIPNCSGYTDGTTIGGFLQDGSTNYYRAFVISDINTSTTLTYITSFYYTDNVYNYGIMGNGRMLIYCNNSLYAVSSTNSQAINKPSDLSTYGSPGAFYWDNKYWFSFPTNNSGVCTKNHKLRYLSSLEGSGTATSTFPMARYDYMMQRGDIVYYHNKGYGNLFKTRSGYSNFTVHIVTFNNLTNPSSYTEIYTLDGEYVDNNSCNSIKFWIFNDVLYASINGHTYQRITDDNGALKSGIPSLTNDYNCTLYNGNIIYTGVTTSTNVATCYDTHSFQVPNIGVSDRKITYIKSKF